MQNQYSQRSIRSFAVRSGKLTKGQKSSYRQLAPKYCLPYRMMAENRAGVDEKSREQQEKLAYWQPLLNDYRSFVCEIGFGSGSATWQMIQQHPDTFYLGLEVYRSGIARLMQKAEEHGLKQLRIVEHDGLEVLEHMLPHASLDGLHIFFPDPWPKQKHQKRHLVNAQNLGLFHRCLRMGGYLYFVTDSQSYAAQVYNSLTEGAWSLEAKAPVWRPKSKFEAKALCEGRAIFELFLKTV